MCHEHCALSTLVTVKPKMTDAMDSLVENLFTSFKVDDRPNNTAAIHPLFSQYYKAKGECNQAARRKEFLENQKKKRSSIHNAGRNILEEVDGGQEVTLSVSPKTGSWKNYCKGMRDILMESEWLVDVPSDLLSAWTTVICPQGKRCVIVSSGKTTIAFDKRGCQFLSFPSWLPNGSYAETRSTKGSTKQKTVLDCIYCPNHKSFFILDVIEWNSHSFLNCETDFRFHWLSSKINELSKLSDISKVNPYSIKLANRFPCIELKERMANYPLMDEAVDGLLFYHVQSHYTPGPTPLVGWLKPFMISQILGIDTHPAFKLDCPPNYGTALEYMKCFDEKKDKKKNCHRKKKNHEVRPSSKTSCESMETEVVAESMDSEKEEAIANDESLSSPIECCDPSFSTKNGYRPSSPAEDDCQMPPTKKCLVEGS